MGNRLTADRAHCKQKCNQPHNTSGLSLRGPIWGYPARDRFPEARSDDRVVARAVGVEEVSAALLPQVALRLGRLATCVG
jgi:hypothetical protein